MVPVYYLSVTTNLIMGLILAFGDKESDKYPILRDQTFLLILFILSGIAAVLKLASPIGSDIVIISDLLPALSGAAGCMVFFKRWVVITKSERTLPAFFEQLMTYERIIGFSCLAAGVIHLLFFQVLFL